MLLSKKRLKSIKRQNRATHAERFKPWETIEKEKSDFEKLLSNDEKVRAEYKLIMEKKSKLSSRERSFIVDAFEAYKRMGGVV